MNNLTNQQRKVAYVAMLIVLLIPIVTLGRPTDTSEGSGGVLAKMRQDNDLGEGDIGEIDPSSAAMNLVLLGMRGAATTVLWQQLDRFKDTKDWAQMRATTQSIIRLQPHFVKVWEFNGWNLAFNVSAEWDDVRDRFYWVKEGGKFLKQGVNQNRRAPELPWYTGRTFGFKIGRADERNYFRKYFKSDPDPKLEGKPDPECNPEAIDNYQVAKQWYKRANEAEVNQRQRIIDRTLFRSYPARSQLDYADALQKDGVFGEVTRVAWDEGANDWTKDFGNEVFRVPEAPTLDLYMEMTDDDIQRIAKTEEEQTQLRKSVDAYQKICNYRYWRTRALFEAESGTSDAHRDIYDAKIEYKGQNLTKAREKIESGMAALQKMVDQYPNIVTGDDATVEEAVTATLLYGFIMRLLGEKMPETFPLQGIFQAAQDGVGEIQSRLERELLE